jgi:ABC-type transporter Mla subunit MlaD
MEETRRNLMVGIFVLAGLGALAVLIILFGRAPTWLATGDTYQLHAHFEEASGIREGNLVTAKGIEIGRVDRVELQPSAPFQQPPGLRPVPGELLVGQEVGVDVVLAIKKEFLIPKGSTAVSTEPMLGQGRPPIEILPGPAGAEALPPGATIQGTIRRALDSIFPSGVVTTFETTARQIGDAAEALTPVLDEMKQILEPRSPAKVDLPGGPQGNLSSAIARFDTALRNINDVLGEGQVKNQLRETVANVYDMSEHGKKVVSDFQAAAADAREFVTEGRKVAAKANDVLTNLDGRVTDIARKTMDGLDRADRFLDYLNVVGDQITSGKGTIGQLFMNGKLYDALTYTVERLGLAVEDARALVNEWRKGKIRVSAF